MQLNCKAASEFESDPVFLGQIDDWIQCATEERPDSERLFHLLPGIWPVEVIASLLRLESTGRTPKGYAGKIIESLQAHHSVTVNAPAFDGNQQPLEHPLDYEWLFTVGGQDSFLDEVGAALQKDGEKVLCLGCPTLFERGNRIMPNQQFVLWDKNARKEGQLHEAHALADIDLAHHPLPNLSAAVAVIDPPWYNEFYRLFIWAALQNLKIGGRILLSFPQAGTRPSAESDRAAIVSWVREAGGELLKEEKGKISYRMPLFEANALSANGLHSIPIDWRRADLMVFRKSKTVSMERPFVAGLSSNWEEYRFGPVRVRIRSGDEINGPLLMQSVANSEILPSVSTRFPGRDSANLVTTGNRFLKIASASRVSHYCRKLSRAFALNGNLDAFSCSEAGPMLTQLKNLILRELSESSQYLERVDGL